MTLKRISPNNIKTRRTSLNQLVDIIQEDVSGSATRRAYQVFVTGGVGPGVTSSLYQTIYDQDFTLQTANQIFDLTVGLRKEGATVTAANPREVGGKQLFPSSSLMMREKIDIYRQHAAHLLGNAESSFVAPFGSATASDTIDNALFLNMKRLFTRDGIKKDTFAIKLFRSGSPSKAKEMISDPASAVGHGQDNIFRATISGSTIFTDEDSGHTDNDGSIIGNVKNSGNANETACGLVFYDKGTVVLDMSKVFSGSQHFSGTIQAMSDGEFTNRAGSPEGSVVSAGFHRMGHGNGGTTKFIPDFMIRGSIDDICKHIATTRFGSGSLTSMTFQNRTDINSTLIFCQATADEFNYSSNPTFTDSDGNIVVIDSGQEGVQRTFTFPTTVGLHDAFGNTLAVAKFSRPIEKNDEKDITFRIRLDF